MARLVTSGFELNSLTLGVEIDAATGAGALSLVTSPVHSGSHALEVNPSSAASYVTYNLYASNQNHAIYARTWIYISSLPTGTITLINIINSSFANLGSLKMLTSGKLQVCNSTGGFIGSASSTLALGQWYCIELSVDASVTNGVVAGRLQGLLIASGTGNAAAAGAQKAEFGQGTSFSSTLFFDDIAVNDDTGTAQNGFPGLGTIIRATPNAAGDSNTFLTQVGGTAGSVNNYTRVNETTPDDVSSYNASAIAASDLFGVSIAAIPTGSTINCVVVGSRAADLVGADATASYQTQIEKTSGGTVSKSSAIIPNSTSWKSNPQQPGASTYLHTLYNDPDGNPWTPATITSMQVGYLMDVLNTRAIAVSTVWPLVDYTPPSNTSGLLAFF
jgi:hypothetical protein